MTEKCYKTSLIRDIATQNVATYQQLLLFTRSESLFIGNVERLRKPALEATVYMLIMKLQKTDGNLLPELPWISLDKLLTLVEINHLYLQKEEECFGLILNMLALVVMLDGNKSDCVLKIAKFVEKLQTDCSELPIFYDVLRTLLIVALEKETLQPSFNELNVSSLIRNLYSESHQIRIKSLACLQLLIDFQPEVIQQWHSITCKNEKSVSLEYRSFMLCHLIETVVQRRDQSGSIPGIIEDPGIWYLIHANCQCENQLIRKEALSVLKNLLVFLSEFRGVIKNELFRWNWKESKDISGAWQSFVTIVESLNETQTHLVMPALLLVDKLGFLEPAWKNLILILILKHENQTVSSWGINYLLTSSRYVDNRTELENLFLYALNKTTNFQQFDNTKQSMVRYYSQPEALRFLLTQCKDVPWGAVPFACLLDVIEHLLESTDDVTNLVTAFSSLIEICSTIKNLNLRFLSALQLAQLLISFALRKDQQASDVSLDRIIIWLVKLSKITSTSLVALDRWKEVWQLVDGVTFERLLLRVKPTDENMIRNVLVPYMQNERTSTDRRLKQILDRDLLLATKILQYGNTSFSQSEVKHKFISIIKNFGDDSQETLKSLEIYNELVAVQLPWFDEILQKLSIILHKRLNRLSYQILSVAITIQLVRLFSRLQRMDMVDLFVGAFSLHELFNAIHSDNSDKSLYSCVFSALSEIFLQRLKFVSSNDTVEQKIIMDYAKLIDLGDVSVLSNAMEITGFIMTKNLSDLNDDTKFDSLSEVVNRCYKEVLIYRKSDQFMKLNNMFIAMLLAPWAGEERTESVGHSRWLKEVVSEYFQVFLEQAVVIAGLANILFEKLLLLPIETVLDWSIFGKILMTGLLFGDGQKREQRIEDETCTANRFYDTPLFKSPVQLQSDARVRILCVLFLYRLTTTNHPDGTLFLLKLERMLIEKFQLISRSKERYYADSQTHRHKLRIVQTLCVVSKLTGTKPYPLLNIVLYETNQPNINYLIELIVADSTIDTLTIINSLKTDKVKVSGVQSVFVILWLRCCKTNFLDVEYVNFLLPWTMAQNFSTRLYAQITISKLIEKFYDRPNQSDVCPFANIYLAINSYLKQGNVEKNLEKCMKDFRFNSIFDYENLLTLENVYNNIPRVSRMAPEDVVSTKILKECFACLNLAEVNLGQAIVFDEMMNETKENLFLSQGFGGSDHIQKKIVPLKCLEPSMELLTNLPERLCLRRKENSLGLIIVASLVNRPPNLGGLARSSEIFAVQQYIVNSLKDLENKEFQALSMTAEKWLNVAELKSFQIVDYLVEMKAKGYSIVGAEQTTGSRPIQSIQFPKKSILVLGHEKEGLPAHIISQLDIIAEIPQFGVVRSLNVHVTGAIFMWEYAKQHHASSSK
ncbi:uncharacterized protein LOC131691534 [Topomyia yanbarensis]|uniref:uncharacterized protein LOC131691534 n=1 Tax=Topomyia yanbarensis TaxID=2498891 RepID=UPI00273C2DE1|nr:uncharacterized protein LOC131691534 [Topomyia yanbarensis]